MKLKSFKKFPKLYYLLMLMTFFSLKTKAQCFEIESILVDACGSPEGENEMVRFLVGTTPLNVSNLTVSWANASNSWRGICQGANTAQKTAQLNDSITTCGFLKEPTSGILPAGAKVILATSTDLNVNFNSFNGLLDTLYIIYQCAGNTAGHFANGSGTGTRTLSMSFSSPSGCTDVVSYNRSTLSNIDGATVNYTPNNVASYVYNGCKAPIPVNTLEITTLPQAICLLDSVNLSSLSTQSNVQWSSSGNGTFSVQNNNNTVYYSSTTDVFPLTIYATVSNACEVDTAFLTITLASALDCGEEEEVEEEVETLKIPNVFTPNNDNVNDFFTIDYSGFGVYNLKIYNRWGGLIYESREKSQHWDGKFNNNKASAGTYFYILTIDEKIHKGSLNLFR